MGLDSHDQLEVRFDGAGNIAELNAPGPWRDVMEGVLTRRRMLGSTAGALLGGSFLAACGGGDDDSGSAGGSPSAIGEGQTIGYLVNGINEFSQCELTGVLKTLEKTQYKLLARQSNYNGREEIANAESLLSQGLDALHITSATTQSTARVALRAHELGIEALTFAYWSEPTPADDVYLGVFETDNIAGADQIQEYIAQTVPEGGEIVVVSGVLGQGFTEQFSDGLAKAFEDSSWEIVAEQPANYNRREAIDVITPMLDAHPDANIIISMSAEMGVGIADVLEKSDRLDIVHVTSDANHELVAKMKIGSIDATRYLSPAETGVSPIRMLRAFLEQEKRPGKLVTALNQQMVTVKDLSKNAGPNVINPELTPSLGIICYDKLLDKALALV